MNTLDGMPYDRESERELLCALLADPNYVFRVASAVQPSFFHCHEYRDIYTQILGMSHDGKEVSEITLKDGASEERRITIMELYDNALTGTTALHWAEKVRQYAYARKIWELGNTFIDNAGKLDTFEKADTLLREELERVTHAFHVELEDVFDAESIDEICETIQQKRGNPGIHGIKTGFEIFDRVVKGLKLINLVTAPSGFGKTALAIQWAWNIGVKQKIPMLYLNYEMPEDDMIERFLACGSGVELGKIQLGETTDEENTRVGVARKALSESALFVTGCEEKTIVNTINLLHQYSNQHSIRLCIVDYIGEIGKQEEEYDRNTYALYGEWLQRIKNCCTKLNMKSVVLAQLNRDGYKGPPGMSEVADSMQLIHKAHLACGLYEGKDKRPYLKIFKNRSGSIVQPIPLDFNKKCQQLTERQPF